MFTPEILAPLLEAEILGPTKSFCLTGVADLLNATSTELSFFTHQKYLKDLHCSQAAAVLVPFAISDAPMLQLLCRNPYLSLTKAIQLFHPPQAIKAGRSPLASIDSSAFVHSEAQIDDFVFVGAHAHVGAGSHLSCGVVVQAHSHVGENCLLHPGVKLLERCCLGNRVIIHANTVIGSDGFGFAVDPSSGQQHKIPQMGHVVIEDDVEIGANSAIDRATFGYTLIGRGTKIDNLVQIAHNVKIGKDCIIASQTGVAGSSHLGDRNIVGAQSGINGHTKLHSDVTLAARSGVFKTIQQAGIYGGMPAISQKQWLKILSCTLKLPQIYRQLRILRQEEEEEEEEEDPQDEHRSQI